MLRTRIFTAFVLTAVILALTLSRNSGFVLIAALLMAGVGGAEYMALRRMSLEEIEEGAPEFSHPKLVTMDWAAGAAYLSIPLLVWWMRESPTVFVAGVISGWISLLALLFSALYYRTSETLAKAATTLFSFCAGFAYISLPATGLWGLAVKTLDAQIPCSAFWFVISVVFMGDTGAYFVGRSLGKHKLIPRISPKKTIEGSIGGLVWSALTAAVLSHWFGFGLSIPVVVLVGLLAGCAGQVGDLVESALKRAANCKDSSRWFPGHGGMLDRVDSLLFSIPICLPLFL